jgi:serine protease Do/serine protease DegQ
MLKRLSIIALVSVAVMAAPVLAGLPVAVDGQPLPTLAPMLKRVTPAVVNIATQTRVRVRQNPLLADPFFRRFFNLAPQPRERTVESVGSGVIVDAEKGYVLTNNHVIANADKIVVTLRDRRQFVATLIGTDPATDIAVLSIPAENLTALEMGDSDQLEVGDFVVAIGNPYGIGQTVTSGIVSALRRSGLGIEGFEDFIQTDASINPGNSGGALVTLGGELIGINTAIIDRGGGNVGIGFAIPTNMVRQVMDQLISYGEVSRGLLGVDAQDLTPELAEALGLDFSEGALVKHVGRGSPAAIAGLRQGDIVIAIDGQPVKGVMDVRNKIGLLRVGEIVELTVMRGGEVLSLNAQVSVPTNTTVEGQGPARRLAGMVVGPMSEESPLFGKIEGVQVIKVARSSPAWQTGLREGDIITEVNQQATADMDTFRAALKGGGDKLLIKLRRGNSQLFIVVR